MIQAFITFIAFEYKFQQPPVFVTGVCGFGIKILIRFQNDYTEQMLLSGIAF